MRPTDTGAGPASPGGARPGTGCSATTDAVRAAYGRRAAEYVAAVGSIDHVHDDDLALITTWATGLTGPVLDVGCGPGQWTGYLAGLGVDVEGVDPAPEFLDIARTAHPGARFRLGTAGDLGAGDASLGGILAWYSLIHLPPEETRAALAEFARCLRPGGGLALGFFTGPRTAPFDHAVATAYHRPVGEMAAAAEAAGFAVTHTETRSHRPDRTHAALLALRR